ncbi:hypothetical protein [uncultured Draconibacterium sp.]|uniref:hypothetical protein n=1 Tax=uncultured Draconibacterium sp. TaxID=1573823 RepID=UPI0037478278
MFMRLIQIKYIAGILFTVLVLNVTAQQDLKIDIGEVDSSEIVKYRQLEYYQFITGSFGNDYLLEDIKLPEFDAGLQYRERYTINMEIFPLSSLTFVGITSGPFAAHSPFYHNGQILSNAAYQLGDKFVLGGYSYGANSLNAAPFPNQNSTYFDTYGSTMFLQYKVSKNIKIETSISVGQHQGFGPGF